MKTKTAFGEPVVRVSFRTGLLWVWCLLVLAMLAALVIQRLLWLDNLRRTSDEFTTELAEFYGRLFRHEMGRCNLQFEAVRDAVLQKHAAALKALQAVPEPWDLAALKKQLTRDMRAGEDLDVAVITDKLVIADTSYAAEKGLDLSVFPDAVQTARAAAADGKVRFDYPVVESTREALRAYSLSVLPIKPGWYLQLGYKNTALSQIYRAIDSAGRAGGVVKELHFYICLSDPTEKQIKYLDFLGKESQPRPEDLLALETVRTGGQSVARQRQTRDGRRQHIHYLPLSVAVKAVYPPPEPLQSALFLQVNMDVTAERQRERHTFIIMVVTTTLVIGIGLLVFLWQYRRFLAPLQTVVQAIGNSAAVPALSTVEKNAELATLAHAFNEHLGAMHKEHAALEDTSARLFQEVAERRAAEQKLQVAHDELERRVTERTRALHEANTRLQLEITERKLAQERLLQEQRQLRQLAAQLALAEEHERRRIATGLHDDVGQMLALLKIQFASLRSASVDPAAWAAGVRDLLSHIDAVIRATRSLTFDLCSPVLQDLGFESALQNLCEHMQTQHQMRFVFQNDEHPKPLPHDYAVLLFRMVRELVLNAVKHAQARTVAISLRREGGNIVITVRDDGRGFDACTAGGFSPTGGFGLINIRERVRQSGGQVEILSAPGSGAAISITVPLQVDG